MEMQGSQHRQNNLEREQGGEFTLPEVKTMWYWHTGRYIDY